MVQGGSRVAVVQRCRGANIDHMAKANCRVVELVSRDSGIVELRHNCGGVELVSFVEAHQWQYEAMVWRWQGDLI